MIDQDPQIIVAVYLLIAIGALAALAVYDYFN